MPSEERSEAGFNLIRVGMGGLFGTVFGAMHYQGAFIAATIVLAAGVAIVTITWPFRQPRED